MLPKSYAIACCVLGLAAAPSMQRGGGQFLIESVGGAWEVRAQGQKDRRMAAKYDVITAASQIRCVKAPCTLKYSTDGVAKPLFPAPVDVGKWVSVPQPTEPPVAKSSAELQQLVGRAGVRGGAEKDTPTCGGELPLLAPRCNETIDPAEFLVRWSIRAGDAGKLYTLVLGPADSTERRRWNGFSADAGELQSVPLREYLSAVQMTDRSIDVTVRLIRTENMEARRVVRVLSTAAASEHRQVLRQLDVLAELPRKLRYLEQYLKMGMWSKAAEIAQDLQRQAPNSLEIQKYALVGLCASDFADEIRKLRNTLRDAGVTGVCDNGGAVR